jgi:hypothetical protein
MKIISWILLLLAVGATGCASRPRVKARERAAYAAGQQQALARMQDAQRTGVRVLGNVRNPEILWTDGLTLAQVIVAADWLGRQDPRQIVVVRQRQRFLVDPASLLRGADVPLEPGDMLELHP